MSYRITDWQWYLNDKQNIEIANEHATNLSNLKNINCLILGGSNSAFSLSAEQMSRYSDLNCYNLSLFNEGGSDDAYYDYVRGISFNKLQITNVFYSSFFASFDKPFAIKMQANKDKIGINGDHRFKLLGVSLASRLQNLLQGKSFFPSVKYPSPTKKGDFNFSLFEGCESSNIVDTFNLPEVNDVYKNWLNSNLSRIQSLFQNAQVYFVLPSTLRTAVSNEELASFSASLQQNLKKRSIIYLEQSRFSNRDVLCDNTHHANDLGRKIRTVELIKLIDLQNN